MSLAGHQRALAAVLVTGEPAPDGSYAAAVAGTAELALMREVGARWRSLGLRLHCPLTWQVLGPADRRMAELDRFAAAPGRSQHLHVQSRQFLDFAAVHDDPEVAAVARFERSVLDAPGARDGDRVVIDWPCHPVALLRALAGGRDTTGDDPAPHRSEAPATTPTLLTVTANRT
jgi:hypothetical protein